MASGAMYGHFSHKSPYSRNLFVEMQAESCGIPKRSPIVAPGIVFAQGYHSGLAAEFWGGERRAVYEPMELNVSAHRLLAIVHAPRGTAHVGHARKGAIL